MSDAPPEMSTSTTIEELKSWWEVPTIAHFCHIFSECLELPDFDIDELEHALINNNNCDSPSIHPLIVKIHIHFLKGILEKKDISEHNWELLLKLHFVWRCEFLNETYNPMQDLEYSQLDTRTKVDILYKLCTWRLELEDVCDNIKGLDSCEMRLEDIGLDRSCNRYWYFYGLRLYRETKETYQYNRKSKVSSSLKSTSDTLKSNSNTTNNFLTPNKKARGSALTDNNNFTSTPRKRSNKTKGEDESAQNSSEEEVSVSTHSGSSTPALRTMSTRRSARTLQYTSTNLSNTTTTGVEANTSQMQAEIEYSLRTGWSVVCESLEDWTSMLLRLSHSESSCEAELVEYINQHLLDTLTQLQQEKHKKQALKALLADDKPSLLSIAPGTTTRISQRLENRAKPSYIVEHVNFLGLSEYARKNLSYKTELYCAASDIARQESSIASSNIDSDNNSNSNSFIINDNNGTGNNNTNISISGSGSEDEEEIKLRKQEMRNKENEEWQKAFSGDMCGPRKTASSVNTSNLQLEDDTCKQEMWITMFKVIDQLKKHEECWPFVDPVTDAIAPGYSEAIKHPMDITTIEKKIKAESYSSCEEFVLDMKCILKNCKTYNGVDSEYTEMAEHMRKHFNKIMKKIFPQIYNIQDRKLVAIRPIHSSSSEDETHSVLPASGIKKRRKRRSNLQHMSASADDNINSVTPTKRSKNRYPLTRHAEMYHDFMHMGHRTAMPHPFFMNQNYYPRDIGGGYYPYPHEYPHYPPYFPPFMPTQNFPPFHAKHASSSRSKNTQPSTQAYESAHPLAARHHKGSCSESSKEEFSKLPEPTHVALDFPSIDHQRRASIAKSDTSISNISSPDNLSVLDTININSVDAKSPQYMPPQSHPASSIRKSQHPSNSSSYFPHNMTSHHPHYGAHYPGSQFYSSRDDYMRLYYPYQHPYAGSGYYYPPYYMPLPQYPPADISARRQQRQRNTATSHTHDTHSTEDSEEATAARTETSETQLVSDEQESCNTPLKINCSENVTQNVSDSRTETCVQNMTDSNQVYSGLDSHTPHPSPDQTPTEMTNCEHDMSSSKDAANKSSESECLNNIVQELPHSTTGELEVCSESSVVAVDTGMQLTQTDSPEQTKDEKFATEGILNRQNEGLQQTNQSLALPGDQHQPACESSHESNVRRDTSSHLHNALINSATVSIADTYTLNATTTTNDNNNNNNNNINNTNNNNNSSNNNNNSNNNDNNNNNFNNTSSVAEIDKSARKSTEVASPTRVMSPPANFYQHYPYMPPFYSHSIRPPYYNPPHPHMSHMHYPRYDSYYQPDYIKWQQRSMQRGNASTKSQKSDSGHIEEPYNSPAIKPHSFSPLHHPHEFMHPFYYYPPPPTHQHSRHYYHQRKHAAYETKKSTTPDNYNTDAEPAYPISSPAGSADYTMTDVTENAATVPQCSDYRNNEPLNMAGTSNIRSDVANSGTCDNKTDNRTDNTQQLHRLNRYIDNNSYNSRYQEARVKGAHSFTSNMYSNSPFLMRRPLSPPSYDESKRLPKMHSPTSPCIPADYHQFLPTSHHSTTSRHVNSPGNLINFPLLPPYHARHHAHERYPANSHAKRSVNNNQIANASQFQLQQKQTFDQSDTTPATTTTTSTTTPIPTTTTTTTIHSNNNSNNIELPSET